jgi:dihydroorotate dehydrogenase (NAD+) catalytic subunit
MVPFSGWGRLVLNSFLSIPDLTVNLGRILLKNPVTACSGTFASGTEYANFFDISILGAVTTKSFSINKIQGNPPPRICETPSGMLNSIGLQNEGIKYFFDFQFEKIKKSGVSIILSIFGHSAEEFRELAARIQPFENSLTAVELNFSCPNISKNGACFSAFPDQVGQIVSEVRKILNTGIIAKLSPNFDTIIGCSYSAAEAGADAISIINTLSAAAFDIETFKPKLGNITGGLSGPAIKPVAVMKVYQLAKENILPVIGMGGIYSWEDAIEFIIAGASAVGVGTANFADPKICPKILDGIVEYLKRKNFHSIKSITGAAINVLQKNKNGVLE